MELEKKCRSTAVKAVALQSDVLRHLESLRQGKLADMRSMVDILPAWRESLRSVVVAPVEDALTQALHAKVEHIRDVSKGSKSAEVEDLDALVDLLKHADTMLRRPNEVTSKYGAWAMEAEQLRSQVLDQINMQKAKQAAEPYLQDRRCRAVSRFMSIMLFRVTRQPGPRSVVIVLVCVSQVMSVSKLSRVITLHIIWSAWLCQNLSCTS